MYIKSIQKVSKKLYVINLRFKFYLSIESSNYVNLLLLSVEINPEQRVLKLSYKSLQYGKSINFFVILFQTHIGVSCINLLRWKDRITIFDRKDDKRSLLACTQKTQKNVQRKFLQDGVCE